MVICTSVFHCNLVGTLLNARPHNIVMSHELRFVGRWSKLYSKDLTRKECKARLFDCIYQKDILNLMVRCIITFTYIRIFMAGEV